MSTRVVSGALAALGALGLSVLSVAVAVPAHAHDVLISTAPAAGSTVGTPPANVTLTFDRPALAIGSGVTVTGPGGVAAATGAPVLVDNTVRQAVRPGMPAGAYTVRWRITSADGHPVSGTFAFTARRASAGAAASSAVPTASATRTGSTSAVPAAEPSGGRGSSTWVEVALAAVAGTVIGVLVVLVQRRRRRQDGTA